MLKIRAAPKITQLLYTHCQYLENIHSLQEKTANATVAIMFNLKC